MLLGVVEENRKKEVMENLGVCAKLVEKIKTELAGLEGIYYETVKCVTVIYVPPSTCICGKIVDSHSGFTVY